MTIAELINQLQRLDQTSEIVVAHQSYSYWNTEMVNPVTVSEHELVLQRPSNCWSVVDERDKLEDSDVTKEVVVIR